MPPRSTLLSLAAPGLADLRLLLFATIILGLVCSLFLFTLSRLVLAHAARRGKAPASRGAFGRPAGADRLWALGTLFGTLGIVALSLQSMVPVIFSVVGGNVLIMGGLGLIALGVRVFFNRSRRLSTFLVLALPVLLALLLATYAWPSVRIRAILFSLVSALTMFDAAYTVLRARHVDSDKVSLLAPLVFLAIGLFLSFRCLYFVFVPVDSIFSPGLMTSLTFMVFNIGFVSWTLALIMLRSGRLLGEVTQGERLYRGIFERASTGIFQSTLEGQFLRVNEALVRLFGYASIPEFFAERGTSTAWVYAQAGTRQRLVALLCTEGHFEDQEVQSFGRDGSPLWLLVNATLIDPDSERPVFTGTVVDVTERHLEGEALAKARDEKVLLLHELQHRVKNGMGVIAGLVGLEVGRSTDDGTRSTLEALEGKVSALASLYDLLYRSPESRSIGLGEYLGLIVDNFRSAHGLDERGITLSGSFATLQVGLKDAEALGLVTVELLTDSLKHAFPGGRRGSIRVSLRTTAEGALLEVEDDGIGLPEGFSTATSGGLGMTIVETLAAQLRGGLSAGASASGGCRFELRFPLAH